MDEPDGLAAVWANAERELALMLSAAANRLDLEAVEKYSAAIRQVRELASGTVPRSRRNSASYAADGARVQSSSRSSSGEVSAQPAVSRGAISRPTTRFVGGKKYPRFHREGDTTVVKIGYSKSKRSRYEHRSPSEVLDSVALALNKLGTGDRLFNTEELLDPKAGLLPAYPTYQTYLCLAFLVHQELLIRFGRQGYRLSPAARGDFPGAVRQAFEKLPSK